MLSVPLQFGIGAPAQQMFRREQVMSLSRLVYMHISKCMVSQNNGSLWEILPLQVSQPVGQPAALGSPMTSSVPSNFCNNMI